MFRTFGTDGQVILGSVGTDGKEISGHFITDGEGVSGRYGPDGEGFGQSVRKKRTGAGIGPFRNSNWRTRRI